MSGQQHAHRAISQEPFDHTGNVRAVNAKDRHGRRGHWRRLFDPSPRVRCNDGVNLPDVVKDVPLLCMERVRTVGRRLETFAV
jgi:hypothetical protein